MNNLTAYERETIITYNQEEDVAEVFTYHRALQNKLNKLVGVNPDIKVLRQDEECATYSVPKSWVKVSPPRQVNYSDEQRAAMAERLAAARRQQ